MKGDRETTLAEDFLLLGNSAKSVPMALVFDFLSTTVCLGYLFISDAVGSGLIDRCSVNKATTTTTTSVYTTTTTKSAHSMNCTPVVTGTQSPGNLVVDVKNNLLYWSDVKGYVIKQVRLRRGYDGAYYYELTC